MEDGAHYMRAFVHLTMKYTNKMPTDEDREREKIKRLKGISTKTSNEKKKNLH